MWKTTEDCGKAQRTVGDLRKLWERANIVESMENCGRTWRTVGEDRGLWERDVALWGITKGLWKRTGL